MHKIATRVTTMGRRPATNSIVLRYGLHLFRRDTTIWQVYIKLNGEKPVRKSLKTDDQSEATQLAWKAYTEATARQIKGYATLYRRE